jgi:ABC-type branched-subunit amino acid transport system substrate-binding protein
LGSPSLTGADAENAELIKDGALLAFEEQNAKGGIAGYKLETIILDSVTATAGQYDPAQAATDTEKLAANLGVVANIGPEMSDIGKAMSAILSEADLATSTPRSTNPDITDPKFTAQFRPQGKNDLLPHGNHRCLPGAEHGQLFRRGTQGEVGLRSGQWGSVWRWHRQLVPAAG